MLPSRLAKMYVSSLFLDLFSGADKSFINLFKLLMNVTDYTSSYSVKPTGEKEEDVFAIFRISIIINHFSLAIPGHTVSECVK